MRRRAVTAIVSVRANWLALLRRKRALCHGVAEVSGVL